MKEYKVAIDKYGTTRWYNEAGKYHREDGPAVEWADGGKAWYINGEELTEQQFNNRNNIPEYTMEELVTKLGNFKIKK